MNKENLGRAPSHSLLTSNQAQAGTSLSSIENSAKTAVDRFLPTEEVQHVIDLSQGGNCKLFCGKDPRHAARVPSGLRNPVAQVNPEIKLQTSGP